jgi:hypothetical protein
MFTSRFDWSSHFICADKSVRAEIAALAATVIEGLWRGPRPLSFAAGATIPNAAGNLFGRVGSDSSAGQTAAHRLVSEMVEGVEQVQKQRGQLQQSAQDNAA